MVGVPVAVADPVQQGAFAQAGKKVVEIRAETFLRLLRQRNAFGEQKLVLLRDEAEQEAAADAVADDVFRSRADMAAAVRAACLDFPGAEDGLACNGGIFAPEVAAGVQRADELRRCLELLDGLAQQGDFVLRGEVVLVGVGGKHVSSFNMDDVVRFADDGVLPSRNQSQLR